jgi:hypothetical protein
MGGLLKRTFDLWVKRRWLKTIEKEADKCNRLSKKLLRQKYVLNTLLDEYMKIYGEDLCQADDFCSHGTPQKEQ